MAFYTYDEEADALYILLAPDEEMVIARTVEVSPRLHVDLDGTGKPVGVEILYPRLGPVDLDAVNSRFKLNVRLPFNFAA